MVDPLETAVEEVLTQLGYELVECRRVGSPQRPLLQVRIDHRGADRPDPAIPDRSVTADDCVRASRVIEQVLESRGLVGAEYTLEVSSPGSDRPLRKVSDWERFRGERAKVKHRDFHGSKYGTVEGPEEARGTTHVRFRAEDGGEALSLSLEGMREAKLAPKFEFKKKPGAPKDKR